MDVRYKRIGSKMYDVCSFDNYVQNPNVYDQSMTAIELDGYVYPVRSKYDPKPGIYVGNVVSMINFPEDDKKYLYKYSSETTIDFNNLNDIRDAMAKNKMVKDMQNDILSNTGSVTHYDIKQKDKPIMVAMKSAWNAKNADMDAYSQRFGPNYNNDRRLFNKESMSLEKAISIGTNTDMKLTLIIEDMSPDVPNPIGKKIVVALNGGNEDEQNDSSSVYC